MKKQIFIVFFFMCFAFVGRAYTQTPPVEPPPAPPMAGLTPEQLKMPFKDSFFLSSLEIAVIQQALQGKTARPETISADAGRSPLAIPQHRVISISGVFYRTPSNWVVWMNGKKVTPKNLLPEIVDIAVRDSSKVSLQWYDIGLNKVIAITLRPHQTYDIPTGILLPGSQ